MIKTATLELLAGATLAALAFSPAHAQTFPSKPIRIVSAYAAGGPTELLSRTVGEPAAARLGQPVLPEARPGANERIATEYVLRTPADGYTVLLIATPHATNPSLFELKYDTRRDFTGLIHLVNILPMITTHPDSGIRTLGDLVKLAKAKPGSVTYGSPGNATGPHLLMELIGLITDTQMQHVPYKGDAPALTELLGGRLSASSNAMSSSMPYVKAGRLRALAIAGKERSPLLPDAPTIVEAGYPEAAVTGWFGLVVRSDTPRDIVARLNTDFDAALRQPDVREKLAGVGMIPAGGSPEAFTSHIHAEIDRWARVIKTRGIKAE
jgi:tripartite-type tricarboxylate transporter receptor subunit TctC